MICKYVYAKYIVIIFLFFAFQGLPAITLQQKIDLINRIKQIRSLINQRKFSEAKYFAIDIKKEYTNTEFVPLANYYLSRIEAINGGEYTALYYLNMAMKNKYFSLLSEERQYKIIFYAAKINYKVGVFDTAKKLFYKCLDQIYFKQSYLMQNYLKKDSVYLYLADIYINDDKNNDKAKFFLGKVNWKNINFKEKELYTHLMNAVSWSKIDTKLIGYQDPNVSCSLIDNDVIYIGLWHGGLIRYNYILGSYKFYGVSSIANENVRALYKNKRFIYIGTTNGVSVIDKRTGTMSTIDELADKSISSITGDKWTVFFGTLKSSIIAIDRKENKFTTIGNFVNVSKLYVANDKLIITTYPYGIFLYKNGVVSQIRAFGTPRYAVTDVKEYGGYLWFATYGGGVYKYSSEDNVFYRYSSLTGEIDENYCLCINASKGKVYCGTLGGGIYYYSTVTDKWNKFRIPDLYFGTDIKTIDFTDDDMFIGTLGDGVLQFSFIKK